MNDTRQTILDAIEAMLQSDLPARASGVHVVSSTFRHEGDWVYVAVSPGRGMKSATDLVDVLERTERAVRQQLNIKLLLTVAADDIAA
ncbi:hypothetical protein BH11PLA1_BH11PLA1_09740 [soil metagenome]